MGGGVAIQEPFNSGQTSQIQSKSYKDRHRPDEFSVYRTHHLGEPPSIVWESDVQLAPIGWMKSADLVDLLLLAG